MLLLNLCFCCHLVGGKSFGDACDLRGSQNDAKGDMWCAIIENSSGKFIGKATQNQAWYGHNGDEFCERWRYTIVEVPLYAHPDPVGEPVLRQEGYGDGDLWHAVATTEHGRVPAKASRDRVCWYTYAGKEIRVTENFEYLCVV